MTFMSKSIVGLTVLALADSALTHAAEKSVGQREYESKCVILIEYSRDFRNSFGNSRRQ